MLLGSICSAEPRARAIKQHTLWNHKADLKNWHLMAYNWNKFPEIGPRREAWVHAQRPLPSSARTAPCGCQEGVCPLILGEKPCHSSSFQFGPNIYRQQTVGRLLTGISPTGL